MMIRSTSWVRRVRLEEPWWLIGLFLMVAVGCRQADRPVVVLVSGDSQGWITPCGCAANQSGGLARRATLVSERKAGADVLLLDVGGSAIGTSEYQRLKFASLLRGLNAMNLAAMNVGASETEFSPSELIDIGSPANIRWLATNLRDEHGEPFGNAVLKYHLGGLEIEKLPV
ncbi:MAG: hypothetical protein R3C05_13360 [Pirellulaceae bacterium]